MKPQLREEYESGRTLIVPVVHNDGYIEKRELKWDDPYHRYMIEAVHDKEDLAWELEEYKKERDIIISENESLKEVILNLESDVKELRAEINTKNIILATSEKKKSIPPYPSERPPLGLTPQWVRQMERIEEIMKAISRYREAKKEVPKKWVAEFRELTSKIALEGEVVFDPDEPSKLEEAITK